MPGDAQLEDLAELGAADDETAREGLRGALVCLHRKTRHLSHNVWGVAHDHDLLILPKFTLENRLPIGIQIKLDASATSSYGLENTEAAWERLIGRGSQRHAPAAPSPAPEPRSLDEHEEQRALVRAATAAAAATSTAASSTATTAAAIAPLPAPEPPPWAAWVASAREWAGAQAAGATAWYEERWGGLLSATDTSDLSHWHVARLPPGGAAAAAAVPPPPVHWASGHSEAKAPSPAQWATRTLQAPAASSLPAEPLAESSSPEGGGGREGQPERGIVQSLRMGSHHELLHGFMLHESDQLWLKMRWLPLDGHLDGHLLTTCHLILSSYLPASYPQVCRQRARFGQRARGEHADATDSEDAGCGRVCGGGGGGRRGGSGGGGSGGGGRSRRVEVPGTAPVRAGIRGEAKGQARRSQGGQRSPVSLPRLAERTDAGVGAADRRRAKRAVTNHRVCRHLPAQPGEPSPPHAPLASLLTLPWPPHLTLLWPSPSTRRRFGSITTAPTSAGCYPKPLSCPRSLRCVPRPSPSSAATWFTPQRRTRCALG